MVTPRAKTLILDMVSPQTSAQTSAFTLSRSTTPFTFESAILLITAGPRQSSKWELMFSSILFTLFTTVLKSSFTGGEQELSLGEGLFSTQETIFVLVRLFSMTLFWGVSDFPVSYHGYLYFSFFYMWILICWCEKNTGRHFKGFYLSKILRHAKQ